MKTVRIIRPRLGDIWEIKIPNKPKKVKKIGRINRIWLRSKDGRGEHGHVRRVYIHWHRQPKGRYSGITLKGLLKYGRLIQSNANRVAIEKAIQRRQEMAQ